MAFNINVNGTKAEAITQIDKEIADAHLNAALKQVVEAIVKVEGTGTVSFTFTGHQQNVPDPTDSDGGE